MKHVHIKEEPLQMKIIDAYFIVRAVTTLIGFILFYTNYFYFTRYGVLTYISFMFEDLTIYAISPLIPLLHALAFGVAYWGLRKDIGIARLLAILLLFIDVFAFPIGTIISIAMIIYLALPATARFFTPIAKQNIYYRGIGMGILAISLAGFFMTSGMTETVMPATEEPMPMLSALDKIDEEIDIEREEKVDVIVEMLYTTSMMQAVNMQSVVLQEVQLLGGELLGSTYKTVNAINTEIDADRLEELATNPNVKRIIKNEPVVKLMFLEGSEEEYVWEPVRKIWAGNVTATGKGIVIAIVDSGINEDVKWLQRDGRSIVIESFELHGDWVHWHGTAVAGCIASQHPEFPGVAPDVDLLDVEVFLPTGQATYFDIIRGWEWVVDWKESNPDRYVICSNSLGVPTKIPGILDTALDNMVLRYDIPMVVASGNEYPRFHVTSPGMARYALTVGAVDSQGRIADFSGRGPVAGGIKKPDVVALGVNVHTINPDGFVITPSGTSFATPIVSGALALLIEDNQDYGVEQLYDAIRNGAEDVGETGFDDVYGYGIADLEGAELALTGEKPSRYYLYMFALMPIIALAILFYPELDKLLALY